MTAKRLAAGWCKPPMGTSMAQPRLAQTLHALTASVAVAPSSVFRGPRPARPSVTSSPNPSTFGQQVTITATVGPAGPPTPTGTVGFTSNGTAISGCTAVTLNSRTAVCTTSGLAVGTDAIVATYSGDSNYVGSSGIGDADREPGAVAGAVCGDRAVPHRRYSSCQRHIWRTSHHRQFLALVPADADGKSLRHSRRAPSPIR